MGQHQLRPRTTAMRRLSPQHHFEKTVRHGASRARPEIAGAVTVERTVALETLQAQYPSAPLALWGLTESHHPEGHGSSNKTKWQALNPRTVAAFLNGAHVFASGTLVATCDDPDTAAQLWSLKKRRPFRYMYALTDLRSHEIDWPARWHGLTGKSTDNVLQSLQLPSADHAAVVLDLLGAEPDCMVGALAAPTDRQVFAWSPRNRPHSRRHSCRRGLPAPSAALTCRARCCGRRTSRSGARAQRRSGRTCRPSGCSRAKLGCDDLYEHGWLGVSPTDQRDASVQAFGAPSPGFASPQIYQWRIEAPSHRQSGQYFNDHFTATFRRPLS
jgi:hypothetical protein